MVIIFNQLGAIVSTTVEPIRQGDTNHTLRVTFEGKRNFDYVARFNLTRPDGSVITNVLMDVDSDVLTDYVVDLDSDWYFAKHGSCTLTVFLVDANEQQIASGQLTLAVEQTDYDGEPTITSDEYLDLLSRLAQYLLKTGGEISGNLSVLGNLIANNGNFTTLKRNNINVADANELNAEVTRAQGVENTILAYFTEDGKAVKAVGDQDGNNLKSSYGANLNLTDVNDENQYKIRLQLINKNGLAIGGLKEITIDSASSSKAGLMTPSQKQALEDVVEDLEDEITERENSVALKEDKANKKTSVSASSTDTDYLSAKAIYDFVNSSINNVSAFYITKNAQGDAFETKAELTSASTFYCGGEVRVPTRNDYCIVRADETHDNATTRYIYQNGWEFQYVVNETPLTQAQLLAINSGITALKVSAYDQALADMVKKADFNVTGGVVKSITINNVNYPVAESISWAFAPKVVAEYTDLPEQNDGFLYLVLEDMHLYYYEDGWQQGGLYNIGYVTVDGEQDINDDKAFKILKGVKFKTRYGTRDRVYKIRGGSGGSLEILVDGIEKVRIGAGGSITPLDNSAEIGSSLNKYSKVNAVNINNKTVDNLVEVVLVDVGSQTMQTSTTPYLTVPKLTSAQLEQLAEGLSVGKLAIIKTSIDAFIVKSADYINGEETICIDYYGIHLMYEDGSVVVASATEFAVADRKISGHDLRSDITTLQLKADLLPTTETHSGTTFSGSLASYDTHLFTDNLTSLTITALSVASGDEEPMWLIDFKTGATFTFTATPTIVWNGGTPSFSANKHYTLVIRKSGSEYLGTWLEF